MTTLIRRRLNRVTQSDAGMTTAEYAIGTVAAAGFGGVLYKLLTSDMVSQLLSSVIQQAFSWAFGH